MRSGWGDRGSQMKRGVQEKGRSEPPDPPSGGVRGSVRPIHSVLLFPM